MCTLIWDKGAISGIEPCCPIQKCHEDAYCTILWKALADLVGSSDKAELEAMALAIRCSAVSDEDKADALNGIHALLLGLK